MVAECVILFRIQRFQQGGCRVSPEIAGHLVNLIQKEQGIQAPRLLHAVDQPSRHSPDISAAMSANLSFIPYPAQRNTGKFTVYCFGNGNRHGSLAHTGRPHKTQDWRFIGLCQLLYRKVLQYSLFDLFQAIMMLVKNFGCLTNIKAVLVILSPWQIQHSIQIVSDNCAFSHHGRHFNQPVYFFAKPLRHLFGKGKGFYLFPVFLGLGMNIFFIAQFLAYHLYLFPQIILFLVLFNTLMNFLGDTLFQLGNRHFLMKDFKEFFQT